MKSELFSKVFLVASVERAIKTFAQVLVALFAGGQADILTVDWSAGLVVAGTAVLLSFLTSVVSAGSGPKGSPSLVPNSPMDPAEPAV